MGARDGIGGIVAEGVGAARDALGERDAGEQLLLPIGRHVAPGEVAEVAERERSGGRPKGAIGRTTRELRAFLGAQGADPLMAMARWAQLSPEELAQRIGCTKLEAFDRLMSLWDRVAPYVHARLAPTDGKGNAVPWLHMSIGGAPADPHVAGARPPWETHLDLVAEKAEQSQHVGDVVEVEAKADRSKGEE